MSQRIVWAFALLFFIVGCPDANLLAEVTGPIDRYMPSHPHFASTVYRENPAAVPTTFSRETEAYIDSIFLR